MPDMIAESGGINHSRRDDNSRLLWQSQLGKANPWEHRGTKTDEDERAAPPETETPAGATSAPPTLIPQRDRLQLHQPESDEVDNPFESLLRHRLHVDLTGHEDDRP